MKGTLYFVVKHWILKILFGKKLEKILERKCLQVPKNNEEKLKRKLFFVCEKMNICFDFFLPRVSLSFLNRDRN